jgi:hypothetical protein
MVRPTTVTEATDWPKVQDRDEGTAAQPHRATRTY